MKTKYTDIRDFSPTKNQSNISNAKHQRTIWTTSHLHLSLYILPHNNSHQINHQKHKCKENKYRQPKEG